jgi:hypothetical protein
MSWPWRWSKSLFFHQNLGIASGKPSTYDKAILCHKRYSIQPSHDEDRVSHTFSGAGGDCLVGSGSQGSDLRIGSAPDQGVGCGMSLGVGPIVGLGVDL